MEDGPVNGGSELHSVMPSAEGEGVPASTGKPGLRRRIEWWDWRVVAAAVLGWKAAYLAMVFGALLLWGEMDEPRFRGVMMRWPREGGPVFASHFATWDGAHYLFLSEEGYRPSAPSNAFYPLYPLLMRWGSVLTGGNHLIAGLALANLCSLTGWVLFYELTRRRFGVETALWALALLLVFPGSLFYQFVYTEGLFFLLLMLLWMGLERQRYGWAWTAAFLLPMTRAIGLFSMLPIAWHLATCRPLAWMRRWGCHHGDIQVREGAGAEARDSNLRNYGLLLAPLAGWAVYLGLMAAWTGSAFAGFEAQQHWQAHSIWNLVNVPKFVGALFKPAEWHAFRGSVLDRCLFVMLLYALPLIWNSGRDLTVWTYLLGIMPAMSGMFTSFTRFEAVAFPLFIALASFFTKQNRRWGFACVLMVSMGLHICLLWGFVNFRWAG